MAGEMMKEDKSLEEVKLFGKDLIFHLKKTNKQKLNQTSSTFEKIIEEYIFKLKKGIKLTNMKEHSVQVI